MTITSGVKSILMSALFVSLAQTQPRHLSIRRIVEGKAQIAGQHGRMAVEFRQIEVRSKRVNRDETGQILVIQEPKSGVFTWQYFQNEKLESPSPEYLRRFYLDGDTITRFDVASSIYIGQSSLRARGLAQAVEMSLAAMDANLVEDNAGVMKGPEWLGKYEWQKRLRVPSELNWGFFQPEQFTIRLGRGEFAGIEKVGSAWRLKIKGWTDTAEIEIDETFTKAVLVNLEKETHAPPVF